MASIFAIVVVLALGYLGVVRGFFSSLLHMACVIIAGALAFAFWEPVAYFILERAPRRGFLEVIEYSAWAISLIVPFAVSLALLRVASDKLVPANAKAGTIADNVGAGLCGAISGVIVAGIMIISIGTMRFKSDQFGYQPVRYQGESLQRNDKMLFPVDQIVGKLYAHTSDKAFASAEPLARWRPEPWHAAEVLRINDRGLARNTARPKDYSLLARYTVEAAGGENLLEDRWANRPHDARMLDGEKYPADSRIEAVILDLKTTLREPGSSFVSITEGQVWMIAENGATGERLTLHPIAVVANPQGAEESLARFPFDSNFAISSSGAASRPMAFEFVVPKAFEPIAVYVKNIRQLLRAGQEPTEYASVAARDQAIGDGTLISGAKPIPADYGREQQPPDDNPGRNNDSEAEENGIKDTNQLGRLTIQKGGEKKLRIGEGNRILEGEDKWAPSALSNRTVDQKLRIDRFNVDRGVVMVQVDVSVGRPLSLVGQVMATAQLVVPPQLVDTKGTAYEAVGWIYQDRDMVYIRYTPGQTIRGLSQLRDAGIVLSGSRSDQQLKLLFLCSQGVEIKTFRVGNKDMVVLEEPLKLEDAQK